MRSLLVLFLTACTPATQYVVVELHRPVRPVLPKVKASELQCLSPDAYQRLYDRQRLITGYGLTLEAIVDSTKKSEE